MTQTKKKTTNKVKSRALQVSKKENSKVKTSCNDCSSCNCSTKSVEALDVIVTTKKPRVNIKKELLDIHVKHLVSIKCTNYAKKAKSSKKDLIIPTMNYKWACIR